MTASSRDEWIAEAGRWCALSVAWASAAGVASVVAGATAGSAALVGFGASSVLDGGASAALVWRFRRERAGTGDGETLELRAARAVGLAMIAVAIYLGARSIGALSDHLAPETSSVGIVLASASVVVLPVLARAKLGLATRLRSGALRGDGVLSLAGSILAAATLASLVLHATIGWWWAYAVAALLIAAVLVTEGSRTIASARRPAGGPPLA